MWEGKIFFGALTLKVKETDSSIIDSFGKIAFFNVEMVGFSNFSNKTGLISCLGVPLSCWGSSFSRSWVR